MTAPTAERVIFSQYAEALFLKAYRDRLTPELKRRLREAGLDLDRALLPAYPHTDMRKWMEILADELHRDLPRDQALRTIAQRFLDGWQNTLLGKAMAGMFRLVGPRRSLLRVGRAFKTTDNFTEVTAEELGPTKIRLRFNEVIGIADYFAGLMVAGGHMTGAVNPRATVEREEGAGANILVEWDEAKR